MEPQPERHLSISSTVSSNKSFFARSIIRKETRYQVQNESPKGPLGLTTIHKPAESAAVDLIFVHGLNGGSYSTWSKNGDLSLFWPKEWLPKDDAFRDVRIHTFGYSSSISGESILNVQDFARSLLAAVHDSPAIPRGENVSIKHASVLHLSHMLRL
jgi:hypothetical protein